MEWQPIETAPKDGTWIAAWREPAVVGVLAPLVFVRWHDWGDGDPTAAWVWPDDTYDPFTEHGRARADAQIGRGDYYEVVDEFSHWSPLPAAPTGAA